MKKHTYKNRQILYGYRNLRELSERALRQLDKSIDNAQDVAVMRYVLLQILNWFKTDFKELPLFAKDPFTDDACNGFARLITKYMVDITKDRNKSKNKI